MPAANQRSLTEFHHIVVMGLGVTGLSVVRFIARHHPKACIRVMDSRTQPPGQDQLPDNVELHTGSWQPTWLADADLVVTNPGISLQTPALLPVHAAGTPVVGDIELFAWYCDQPVVAITGSNGKSTVTALVGEMARAAGMNVGVGGNIGVAALDLLDRGHELYVLELSSFQLETTDSLFLDGAAFLNFSEDHMDRYDSLADYRAAKCRIFTHATTLIANADDPQTHDDLQTNSASSMRLFGFHQGDYCLISHQGEAWLAAHGQPLLPVSSLGLVGRHNVANGLAAMALADSVGISQQGQKAALSTYAGLPHRCQKVAEHQGVLWVNDSKATNVASTLAALDGLDLDGRLHLLVGGDGKGADFRALQPALAKLSVSLYCFGKDKAQLAQLDKQAHCVDTLQQAMTAAANQVTAGDMVLLSPACSSLDQFANFAARGDAFIAGVESMIARQT
ncbi:MULTISPECIES: UDP-N-acetylmuramoyl-L-alanine--D-glutamate ligase [unclassified Salinivibrio]|uniref:UDP-N-acetylmuramoyl-L-alanine--D-glutamate ligase n=1 Tax=unclassified Salinivibrio TaxID=2636825 RepID=UPI00128C57DC|nr:MULTISPECIES: UDP-N-acetylmuramoyl-L-alanine--D-glutamate ligase [unclassified Salinivibrio]MPS32360.1 UDP-N-acetylmuramoyl-L-alanine--D-glutamate ligase [Salinivibrio sp. VYel7]MPX90106.1 UDP-N-acetylmuramoyl-L-alanine--D-glutamate ligase [Salinivibrio sp. VYel1]MPX93753.1 UDP-N-acetylmuramoyl-L-alanine--D-glutamate ligase [Salinivibrio sp. VYel9]MPX96584.1 UDP-N-acetylmuramoyl-L-alanine--D-glutamate ligase [Salinivibrio sp. VYel6]MPX99764.1 UDP-N-acetylmuramoyl-L-alanine--D-glutamate liga